ncbi:hypothetical protein AB0284_21415 [Pseudarthrobacter phenanthrenivorans]|uniref:hypothetical protein n=1 Tax=Pseudarthrobacter phenanthrenivorans TaxID=361575 RepID=UPI00344F2CE7
MTRRVLLLDIPAPCKWINSNSRDHRMVQAKLTAIWRNAGTLAVTDENRRRHREGEPALVPFDTKVRIVATIYKKRQGRYDVLNLWPSLKAAIDGIVSAGLLVDDSFEHIIGPDMRHGGFGEPRIVVRIEELKEDRE